MRVILLILAAYAFVGWNDAQAETLVNGYYRVSPTVIATASDKLVMKYLLNLSPIYPNRTSSTPHNP